MLEGRIDSRVVCDGPRARCATLTGSPVWGLGDRFAAFAERHGYRALSVHRPMTPYGLGPPSRTLRDAGGPACPAHPRAIAGFGLTDRPADTITLRDDHPDFTRVPLG